MPQTDDPIRFDADHLPTLTQYRAVVAGTLRTADGLAWQGHPDELRTLRDLWYERHQELARRTGALTDEERHTLDLAEREVSRFGDELERGAVTDVDRRNVPRVDARGGDWRGSGGRPSGRPDVVVRSDESLTGWLEQRGATGDYAARDADDMSFGAILRAMVTGDRRDLSDVEARALGEGTDSAGGVMVPSVLAARVIDLARNQTRVMQAGAVTVPMESDNLTIAKVASDAEPSWRAENAVVSEDDATFTAVTMAPKTLAVIVRASRELVEDGRNVESLLRSIFAAQFALKLDHAALRGAGSSNEPTGVLNQAGINATEVGSGNGEDLSWDTVVTSLLGPLEDANEEPTGIIWTPRTKRNMSLLKDLQDRYLEPPTTVRDVPRYDTNQIPTNLTVGTSTDTTEVYAADWRRLLIGMRTQFFVEVLRERYADNYQYGFLCALRADVAVERAEAFSLLTGVTN